jgi:hypothetical protein
MTYKEKALVNQKVADECMDIKEREFVNEN